MKAFGKGRLLVLAVGGGNDAASSLWLLKQLKNDCGLQPTQVDILAMLPDVLDYRDYEPTAIQNIIRISPQTTRWAQTKRIEAFPEPLLAQHASAFGVSNIYGVILRGGSQGLVGPLSSFAQNYDSILAVDVGGDFIAHPQNTAVLSPMMDSYALYALRQLEGRLPITYAVFGLGTDAESTPEMLRAALGLIKVSASGRFVNTILERETRFYEESIAPNRASGTGNKMREFLRGSPIDDREHSRAVHFHVQPSQTSRKKYAATIKYRLDPEFTGKYYLFESVKTVQNPFCLACNSGLEWARLARKVCPQPSHELNGQIVEGVFMATPPWTFDEPTRQQIIADAHSGLKNGVYQSLEIG